MKKLIIFNLIIIFLLSCISIYALNNKQIEELTPKFVYENGKVLIDDIYVSYSHLDRGQEVEVISEDENYYYINFNNIVLSVLKDFVRLESEEPFKEYDAYTSKGSRLYKDYNLEEIIETFELNDEVKVLDSFMNLLLVEDDKGNVGYMNLGTISKDKIVINTYRPSNNTSGDTPSYSGGGSSGGNSGGGGSSGPSQTSGDGEDISLAYKDEEYIVVLLNDSINSKGKILADNTITYLTVLNRNDDIKVLERNDEEAVLLINGRKAKIASKYIRLETDPAYDGFNGFSRSAHIYVDFSLKKVLKSLSLNEDIKIIDEIDNVYVVELNDGSVGYMRKSDVSKEKIAISAPRVSTSSDTPSYSGGGSNGGNSGGGGSSPSPEPTPEWTDPVL